MTARPRTTLLQCLLGALVALVLFSSHTQRGQSAEDAGKPERIVAVGDVHGDYDQFVRLLRAVGVIDQKDRWSGGKTHLVQTGDVLDRGPDSRKVMDLLLKLDRPARRAGGAVHSLIGNHEAMNVYGDLRYVSAGEFNAFKTPRSEEIRGHFYEQYVEELKRNPPPAGLPAFDKAFQEKWEAERPLGYFEHRVAFGPNGDYGKWIRGNDAVMRVGDTLFLHGGIGPKYAAVSLDEINQRVHEELKDFSKLQTGMVVDSEGPLWYRGLAQENEATLQDHVQLVLDTFGVKRIVIGHTPQPGVVMPRFGGKVVLIDVGLSAAYGGNFACLIIEQGKAFAFHRSQKLELPVSSDKQQVIAYLEKAAALDPSPSPVAPLIQALKTGVALPVSVKE
jgi:hypothetical protein